ncbi:DUF6697 family protein, partial [Acinetobacter baumannii]
ENTCKSEWGNETRTRIALRKRLGRNPTSKEVQAEPDAGKAVTPEQVMAAFDDGEEVSWTLVEVVKTTDTDG